MSDKKESFDKQIRVVNAVMPSVAIVAIAWCAYHASLWHTVETFKRRGKF